MSASFQPSGARLAAMPRAGRALTIFALCFAFMAAGMTSAEAGRRGRGIGIAVGVGVLGAIIANEAARAEERAYRRSERSYRERTSRRYYDDDYYYEDDYRGPAKKKKRASTQSKPSKVKTVKAKQPDYVAAPVVAAPQEKTEPATSETAAASPDPNADNSYLPQTDRKAADRKVAEPERHTAAADPAPAPAAGPVAAAIISTPEEIKSAQEHLQYLGYDIPAASGKMDAQTKSAIREFQQSRGAVPTGALTYDQLQELFVKTAEKAQAQGQQTR
jgi:Putative peptidoglycan binding domain